MLRDDFEIDIREALSKRLPRVLAEVAVPAVVPTANKSGRPFQAAGMSFYGLGIFRSAS
jgi:hypothetical protein